ncbi:MAG: hypothetical protein EPO24_15865 [Bacteroidetes bacterium]|nr:MAG: hypothetical protein EPO24_15865 [Bacteroidota bacterium]
MKNIDTRTPIVIISLAQLILREFRKETAKDALTFWDVWNACNEFAGEQPNQQFRLKDKQKFNRDIFFALVELEEQDGYIKRHYKLTGKRGDIKQSKQLIERITLTEKGRKHLENVRYITLAEERWERKLAEARGSGGAEARGESAKGGSPLRSERNLQIEITTSSGKPTGGPSSAAAPITPAPSSDCMTGQPDEAPRPPAPVHAVAGGNFITEEDDSDVPALSFEEACAKIREQLR